MIIPKQFDGLNDLEAMLLTSFLGTFVSLREDLISINQAESYWMNSFTSELFKEIQLSDELISILDDGIGLKDLQPISSIYYDKIDELIQRSKSLLQSYYTEYSDSSIFSSLPSAFN